MQAPQQHSIQPAPTAPPPPVPPPALQPAATPKPVRPPRSPDDTITTRQAVEHPLFAAEATLAAGGLGHLVNLPPGWAAGGAAAITATSALATQLRWNHTPTTLGVASAGGAAGTWLYHAMDTTPWNLTSLCTLALGSAVAMPLYGLLRWRQTEASEKVVEGRRAERIEQRRHNWEVVLTAAGIKGVYIDPTAHDGAEWVYGERKFDGGFALALRFGDDASVNEAKDLSSYVPAIQRVARNKLGLRLRPGAIQVLSREWAGEAELVVPTKDVLAETYYAPEDSSPRSINDDLVVGRLVDGGPACVNLQDDPHGMFSGATNMGKTSYLNAHIPELTRSIDNRTWAICGHKPSRFFASWMAPFFEAQPDPTTGLPCEPIFDWIAGHLDEAAAMLLDAYKAVDKRQTAAAASKDEKWSATVDFPAITIVIDESPDLLEATKKFDTHRGERVTFSELVLKLVRLARSENIHVILLTQRGTMSLMGDKGSDIKSQLSYRAGFAARSSVELTAVFATDTTGVKLDSLPVGAYYLELTGYTRPVLAKGLYLPKDRKMQIARDHARYARPIDDWTASVMDYYEERWTRASQQEFFRELCADPVRTVPYVPFTTGSASPVDAERPTTLLGVLENMDPDAPFVSWMNQNYPDQKPTDEMLGEFLRDTTHAVGPGPEAQAEVEFLTNLFNAPTAAEHDTYPAGEGESDAGPAIVEDVAVAAINPDLDEDTRHMLGAIAASGVLGSEDEYVLSLELNKIAEEHLGWPFGSEGTQRVAAALRKINVERLGKRPRVTINGETKRHTVYLAADLRAALEQHTVGE